MEPRQLDALVGAGGVLGLRRPGRPLLPRGEIGPLPVATRSVHINNHLSLPWTLSTLQPTATGPSAQVVERTDATYQRRDFPLKFLEFWDLSRPPLAETLLELFEATQEYARPSKVALPTALTTDGPRHA